MITHILETPRNSWHVSPELSAAGNIIIPIMNWEAGTWPHSVTCPGSHTGKGSRTLSSLSLESLGCPLMGAEGHLSIAGPMFLLTFSLSDTFMCVKLLHSCLTLRPCGLQPTRLLCPWDSPGKNSGVGYQALLQGIFPNLGRNQCLLHWHVRFFTTGPPGKPLAFRYLLGQLQDPNGILPSSLT